MSFGYDAASRLTSVNNANANITRQYYNDNLLHQESEQILLSGGSSKTVTYTYDADGNRSNTTYPAPENYAFAYTYTNRNQLASVSGWATYTYDGYPYKGDLTTRSLGNNTSTTYQYDTLDRVTGITHAFAGRGNTRGFDYGYDDVGNRKWTQREDGNGDLFRYDLNDQVNGVWLNVCNPSGTPTPPPNITYDANGDRTTFASDTYQINNLNQYTQRNGTTAVYDNDGNLTTGVDGSSYTHDESLLAISDLMVQFLLEYGKTERSPSFAEAQGASRAGAGSKSKTETTARSNCKKDCHNRGARVRSVRQMGVNKHLPALATKISETLSKGSEYLVTQPAELRILSEMSDQEIAQFAKSHGWRVIRRLGGRQIEFYNDAGQRGL